MRLRMATVTSAALVGMLLPAAGWAQTSGIAGVVRDATGAVLPGVTVEAASPALIEKVRAVVTDGEGQYKVLNLSLGVYSLTFTLPGFSTIKRDGIELTAGFTATVNADMRIGAVEETITVSGSAPLVDTQNTRAQVIVTKELLETLPTGSTGLISIGALTPGMTGNVTVGGSAGLYAGTTQYATTFHGKGGNGSFYTQFEGVRLADVDQNGGTGYISNTVNAEQVTVETGGLTAENQASSVVMNLVPKEGSNTIRFNGSGLFTNTSLQQGNLTDALRARGLTTIGKVDHLYDYDASLGGPIKRDRLWFFGSFRQSYSATRVPGARGFYNKTQGTPFYTADLDRPAYTEAKFWSPASRITWQVSPRNKLNFYADLQDSCRCKQPSGAAAPEAVEAWHFYPQGLYLASWNAPVTNRLLIQGAVAATISHWPHLAQPEVGPNDIGILDTSINFAYNSAFSTFPSAGYGAPKHSDRYTERFSVTDVTGSHAFKVGTHIEESVRLFTYAPNGGLQYLFSGRTPIALRQFAIPWREDERLMNVGLYAQDQWTLNRLTLNGGVRFEYAHGSVPAQSLPAGPFFPARNFAAVDDVPNWKELSPRVGAAYDLFGNGKTALKAALGRYIGPTGAHTGFTSRANPLQTSVFLVQRPWNDLFFPVGDPRRGNYVPDCNLANIALNDECGVVNNDQFGKLNPNATTIADDVLHGFSRSDYIWDVSTEVQRELRPGLSVTGGYYRNWAGNFLVTDNVQVVPGDYTSYCVTAPIDVRLPGGGGYPVCNLADVAPALNARVTGLVAQAGHYGKQQLSSDFFNLSFDARIGARGRLAGGLDTGRTVSDRCFVVDSPQELLNCRVVTPFTAQTQLKLRGSYPLPIPGDFLVSGTFQNVPGPVILADYPMPNALIAPTLGRNLAACGTSVTCAQQATVPLIVPQTMFEDRRTQVDFRVSKTVKLGQGVRLQANVDVYNILNGSGILSINNTYGTSQWRAVQSILGGRLFQFSGRLTF